MAIDVPAFISRNAERGLEYNREGKGGDGLVEQTLEDARDMVRGSISEAKVRKMGPWFARHKVDMEAPANKPDNEDFPGKGAVAWLLWGGSTSGDKMDAAKWAERIVERLDREKDEARNLTDHTTVEKHMDTIEARLTAALAEASAKDAEVAEARSAVEKIASDNIELTAKVAELTAALESLNAEKAVAVAAVEAAVESSVSASVEAAKIAASVGVAPVESAPDAEPKGSILEQYMALSGSDRSKFFDANAVAIRAALRK
jgi:hypothetical protein